MAKYAQVLKSRDVYFPVAALLIDLLYLPSNADPLNPVKFWFLGFFALFCLASILANPSSLSVFRSSKPLFLTGIIISVFTFCLILAFFFTDVKSIGLIGFTGRNNGLLSYFFLILIFTYAAIKLRSNSIKIFYLAIGSGSFLFSIYGFFQHFKIDFIRWNTQNNPISLTVGNPDFAAALLGLFATVLCAFLFTNFSRYSKILVLILISFIVVIIYWSQARQGLVAVAIGAGLLLVTALWQKSHRLSLYLILFEFVAGLVAVLGMLQIGPLTRFLYKASINDRGYDWRAAWHMFMAHPWFGVGLDRYSGYFLRYRDPKYPLIYGYTQTVNNAHNIFLELFATGGIFVGVAYIGVVIFVAWRAFKAWKMYRGNEQMLVSGLIAGWVVFIAQSIISVDNLCVSIWGWLIGGFIVGLSISKERPEGIDQKHLKVSIKGLTNKRLIIFALLASLFLLIVIPMYQGETRMRYFQQVAAPSANSPSQQNIYAKISDRTFNTRLLSPEYRILIAFSVTNNGLIDQGASFFERILKDDPRRSDAHQFLATINEHFKNYQVAINHRLSAKILDPNGAPNLFALENDYISIRDLKSARQIRDLIVELAPGTDFASQASKAVVG